ncbi:MAG: undecaprenyldiphospho-muramoylpentapeptide beta-N-acetylglucosaminyltransferase [Candidatus Omnitrophica bacterium]|nr:undecaprenyldiphospho-muramoylpentapeptide beta-N-acetylglucosaminyltransferase [Candidatus Omnitrophota bacterium]
MKRIIIATGGTGGHLFPALAIGEKLKQKKRDLKILFVGGAKPKFLQTFRKKGLSFKEMRVVPFPSSLSSWLKFPFLLSFVLFQSLLILLRLRPAVVVGMGGAASGPLLLVASFLRIPTLIQEQNILPGLTTKILSHFVAEIDLGFEETKRYLSGKRTVITGNPLRQQILKRRKETALQHLGLLSKAFTILLLGGSSGAHSLNLAAMVAVDDLEGEKEILQIIHLTGEADYKRVKRIYEKSSIKSAILPFTETIEDAYAAADLVIARAGAITISEITSRGLPAILIPYPYAKGKHQEINAQYLQKNQAAFLIRDGELSGPRLAREVLSLLKDRERLTEMSENSKVLAKPEAAARVAERIVRLIKC